MIEELVETTKFRQLLVEQVPIVDVRAPVEFLQGSIPGSTNLPLLTDAERHAVGTVYKEQGQDAAIALGHQFVSGATKELRIQNWVKFIRDNPSAVLTCFRGGLRSKTSQAWLVEAGIQLPRIAGGYKAFRQFILGELARLSSRPLCVISGRTGSGKTLLILEAKKFRPTVNLELLARHRGSAFGAYEGSQPSQANFENLLTRELLQQNARQKNLPIVVEDESRMIGKCSQPEKFFLTLCESSIVVLDEPLDRRVDVVFDEYIANLTPGNQAKYFLYYEQSLQRISKKLGGLRFQEVYSDLRSAIRCTAEFGTLEMHKIWIEKLLVWYYDPLYTRSLEFRKPQIIFCGSREESLQFLNQN